MEGTTLMFNGVTSDMLKGVLNEIIGLIPIVLPVSIGYLGFRKGWNFLFGSLKKA